MNRRARRIATAAPIVVVVGVVGLWIRGDLHAPGTAPGRREIPESLVLLTIEDLRWEHVSAVGYPRRTTPELDRVAGAGLRATAWSPAADPAEALEAILRSHPPDVLVGAEPSPGGFLGSRETPPLACVEGEAAGSVARRLRIVDARVGATPEAVIAAASALLRSRPTGPFSLWLHVRVPSVPGPAGRGLFGADGADPAESAVADYDERLRTLDAVVPSLLRTLEETGTVDTTLLAVVGIGGPLLQGEPVMDVERGAGCEPVRFRAPLFVHAIHVFDPFTELDGDFDLLDLGPTLLGLLGEGPGPSNLVGRDRSRDFLRGDALEPFPIYLRGAAGSGERAVAVLFAGRWVARSGSNAPAAPYEVQPWSSGFRAAAGADPDLESKLRARFDVVGSPSPPGGG